MATRHLFSIALALVLFAGGLSLIEAAPAAPEDEVRKLLATEDFDAARKAALSLKDSRASATWQHSINELERASQADQAEALLARQELDEASRLINRIQRLAEREEVSSLPRIQILKQIIDARLANKNARGSAFLDELGAAIRESNGEFSKRESEVRQRMALISQRIKLVETLSSEIAERALNEQNTEVENRWIRLKDEIATLRAHFSEMRARLSPVAFLNEQEKIEGVIQKALRESSYERGRMLYFQRSFVAARSAAKDGLDADPSDRRLQKMITDLDTITESKSILERLRGK